MMGNDNWLSNAVLQGRHVRLEPLSMEHLDALCEAVSDGKLWEIWYATVPAPEQMKSYLQNAIDAAAKGNIAYAVFCKRQQKIVGSTRFYNVDAYTQRASIGYTWYAKSAQGTAVNPECKLLLMHYLFELKQAVAVEFMTNFMNRQSRAAIESLGAKQDGILRHHIRLPNGLLRDSVVYSIIDAQWPSVKMHLQQRVNKYQ